MSAYFSYLTQRLTSEEAKKCGLLLSNLGFVQILLLEISFKAKA